MTKLAEAPTFYRDAIVWDAHSCLPLRPGQDMSALERHHAAGVTYVGVVPTHRRRGILNQLMRAQLDAIAARGEPVAILWASEEAIYGRYGYGMATVRMSIEAARGLRLKVQCGR